jgi:fibro-slime domain-containing protein
MKRSLVVLAALASAIAAAPATAASYTWTGTIRDFCGGSAGCPQGFSAHPDFEAGIGGLATGIVQSTLGGDGKPVFQGAANDNIQDAASFNQWYNTTAGVNQPKSFGILMNDPLNTGIFTYSNNSFFPIDGDLLGNQGRSHNYHFTYELSGLFGYKAGTNQTFSFTGDDDIWVFINNKLAIDLGGVHGALNGSVNLDTIAGTFGLANNQNYNISIFFAERHTSQSNFAIATSLEIREVAEVPEPSTYALMLAGLGMLGFMARRRMKG